MRLASFALAVALSACAPAPAPLPAAPPVAIAPPPAPTATPAPPDESFRAQPPVPEAPHPFVFPAVTHKTLANGIPVVVTHQPSPLVAVRITVSGGLLDVGADKVDVVAEMMRAFAAGTERLSFKDLREVLASLAMPEPERVWRPDGVSIAGVVPVVRLRAGIDVLAELALRPSFEQKNLERWRDLDATGEEQKDDPTVAYQILRRSLFGPHPYGAFVTAARTRAVTRADVVSLHARLFDTSRISVSVAGGAEVSDVLSALESAFDAAPRKPPHPTKLVPPPPPSGARLVVVDKPGTTIATVLMGAVAPPYGAPDVGPTWLALDALADGRFGRLKARLRDQLGETPRVTSSSSWMHLAGEVSWQTRVPTERVAPVLLETERLLRELGTQGLGEDDLADVKGRRTSAYAAWFETAAATAREVSLLALYQQPDDALLKFPERFAAVSTSDARAAAARYLDPGKVRTVVVGDWAALQASLGALGWGPVELRTADGAVVATHARGPAP